MSNVDPLAWHETYPYAHFIDDYLAHRPTNRTKIGRPLNPSEETSLRKYLSTLNKKRVGEIYGVQQLWDSIVIRNPEETQKQKDARTAENRLLNSGFDFDTLAEPQHLQKLTPSQYADWLIYKLAVEEDVDDVLRDEKSTEEERENAIERKRECDEATRLLRPDNMGKRNTADKNTADKNTARKGGWTKKQIAALAAAGGGTALIGALGARQFRRKRRGGRKASRTRSGGGRP